MQVQSTQTNHAGSRPSGASYKAYKTHKAPKVAKPEWMPLPPDAAATQDLEWSLDTNELQHIHDESGEERRLFRGWASLGGIDYQGHEIAPDAFEKMASEYLSKNPVLLWDHIRHLPIGNVLSLTTTDKGLYIEAEIWKLNDLEWDEEEEARKAKEQGEHYAGKADIGAKCNQVWDLVRTGKIRGLSIRGKARQWQPVYSPELRTHIPRITEILLYEISVTPTQVHPGAKITAVNTLAKALDLCKALPLCPGGGSYLPPQDDKTRPTMKAPRRAYMTTPTQGAKPRGEPVMSEKIKQLTDQLNAELAAAAGEDGSIELDPAVAAQFQQWGASVEFDGEVEKGLDPDDATPPAGNENDPGQNPDPANPAPALDPEAFAALVSGAVEKGLQPIKERIEALEADAPSPAPQPRSARIRTSAEKPAGAKAKPTGAQDADPYGPATVSKALDVLANSINGHADMGKGEYHGCGIAETSQLSLLEASLQGKLTDGHQIQLSPAGQALLQSCASQMSA